MSDEGRTRRCRRQTVFFTGDTAPVKEKNKKKCKDILVEVGDIPQNLKSIMKKESSSSSSSSSEATITTATTTSISKKTSAKNKKQKKIISFNNKYQIQVVSPLPGWREDVVRMPESDEENDVKPEKIRNTILQKIEITPESAGRLLPVNNIKDDDVVIKFNATIVLKDPIEEKPLQDLKKRNRRKSIVRVDILTPEKADNTERIEMTSFSGHGDSGTEEVISEAEDPASCKTKTRKRSILPTFGSNTVEVENSVQPTTVLLTDHPTKNKRNRAKCKSSRRRSMANLCLASSEDHTNNMIKDESIVKINDVFSSTVDHLSCEKRIRKSTKVRQNRLSSWLLKVTPEMDSSLEKENASVEVALNSRSIEFDASYSDTMEFDDANRKPNSSDNAITNECSKIKTENSERQKVKKFRRKSEFFLLTPKNSKPTLKSSSSPEVINVSNDPSRVSKRKAESTGNAAKKSASEDCIYVEKEIHRKPAVNPLDCAPIATFHHMEAIFMAESSQDWPEIAFTQSERRQLPLEGHSFIEVESPSAQFISFRILSDLEREEKLASLDSRKKQWVKTFTECDICSPWSDVFCPRRSADWFGDETVVNKSRNFVSKWKERVAKVYKKDFQKVHKQSESDDDDYDYEGSDKFIANPLILCGPPGSGKTALISSLAAEFNMNVLEVHPGDKRNSTLLKQKFDGALQNHGVQHKTGSITTFFGAKSEKNNTFESGKVHNLLVVEHVDICFEEDRDFWPTLKAMVLSSHVPMIWTCEKVPWVEIHKDPALESYEVLDINYNPTSSITEYLRCLLLAVKSLDVSHEDLKRYVEAMNGDLRRILLDLQYQTSNTNDMRLHIPISSCKTVFPRICDKETTYLSRQDLLEEKKAQYLHILDPLEIVSRDVSVDFKLMQTADALKDRLPQSLLATDYLSYLVEMDRTESCKKSQGRRRQIHYFNEVRSEKGSIDSNGLLIPCVRQFVMP